jgi:dTDP-4-amino-4,6-dideoxygalactose transaminase
MPIPFLDLKRQYLELQVEIEAVAARVLSRGVYVLGPEVEGFESDWADFCHAAAAAAVGSGTDALTLALIASGAVRRDRGDEVITSPLTSPYTALSILNAGGVPVFADIDAASYNIDPAAIEKAISSRTRAIVPVHLYGQMAEMTAISEIADRHQLVVIEDASHAHGAQFGEHALAAAFSFYPTKNLGAFGDGGAVISNDADLIRQIRNLRQGGHTPALDDGVAGRNSRLDEFQAAILRVKLKFLEAWNSRRQRLARLYSEGLGQSPLIVAPAVNGPRSHLHHLYVIQHPQRDRLCEHLLARGIETIVHYPSLLHRQSLFSRPDQAPLPVAEKIVGNILSLPLYPQLKEKEVEAVIEAIVSFPG